MTDIGNLVEYKRMDFEGDTAKVIRFNVTYIKNKDIPLIEQELGKLFDEGMLSDTDKLVINMSGMKYSDGLCEILHSIYSKDSANNSDKDRKIINCSKRIERRIFIEYLSAGMYTVLDKRYKI